MAKPYRKRAVRNFGSAANSVVDVGSKAAVGLFKYVATDHLDMQGAYNRMPDGLGAVAELKYILMQFVIRMAAIAVVGAIMLILIVFLGQL